MLVRTEHSQAHTHRHGTPGAGIKDASKTITRPAYRCHRAAVFCLHAAECAKTTLPPVHDAQGDFFFWVVRGWSFLRPKATSSSESLELQGWAVRCPGARWKICSGSGGSSRAQIPRYLEWARNSPL